MRSVVFPEVGRVSLEDLPSPELLQSTDALVTVHAAAICGSDLHIVAGHVTPETGFPIGHEYVGEIVAVGSAVTRFGVGARVTGPAAPYCRSCDMCMRGQHQRCLRGGILGSGPAMGDLGGAQSEMLRVPWADQTLVARNFGGRRADGSTAFSLDGQQVSSHFFGQSSFAALANVPAGCAVKVDPDAPLEILAPLGCGIQTGAERSSTC